MKYEISYQTRTEEGLVDWTLKVLKHNMLSKFEVKKEFQGTASDMHSAQNAISGLLEKMSALFSDNG